MTRGSKKNSRPAPDMPLRWRMMGFPIPPAARMIFSAFALWSRSRCLNSTPLAIPFSCNTDLTSAPVIRELPFSIAVLRCIREVHFAPYGQPRVHLSQFALQFSWKTIFSSLSHMYPSCFALAMILLAAGPSRSSDNGPIGSSSLM